MISTLRIALASVLIVAVLGISSSYIVHADPPFKVAKWCYNGPVGTAPHCDFSNRGSCNKALQDDQDATSEKCYKPL